MTARGILCAFMLLLLPVAGSAATIAADESVEVSVVPAHNAYLAGGDVRVSVPLPADLLAAAGALQVSAPVAGDISAVGSTIGISAPVAGDVRVAGGHVSIDESVEGDLAVFGGFVRVEKPAAEIYAAGGTVEILGGARGPVTIYGGTVSLAGTFDGDVHVVASTKLTVEPGTVIAGALEYNAPEEATVPEDVQVVGGVKYVGSASFLPTPEEARAFALAGVGIFLIVRLIAGMLTAGLVAGLFPVFSTRIADHVLARGARGFALTALLGLCIMFVGPLLILLLLVSFVGMGVGFLLGIVYILSLVLGYLFAAIVAGGALARTLWKRTTIRWKDAVLGMLILYLVGLLPGLGTVVVFVLSCAALGAIAELVYRFLLPKNTA